jgi:hypothetical protein
MKEGSGGFDLIGRKKNMKKKEIRKGNENIASR